MLPADFPRSVTYRGCVYRAMSAHGGTVIFEPHYSSVARTYNAATGARLVTICFRCSEENWRLGLPFNN